MHKKYVYPKMIENGTYASDESFMYMTLPFSLGFWV